MAGFEIESEVMIDAPIDVVWRTITEPELISQWFADRVELELEPGGDGAMYFGNVDEGGPLVVEAVDPPTRFSYRWNHPAGKTPVEGNSVLVEFTLVSEGDERTRVRVVESGLERLCWPDADKEHYAGEHNNGWATFLGRLVTFAADRPRE